MNKKINNEQLLGHVNKLKTRLWAVVFSLLIIVLAGGFFVFSSFNFKMVTQAFVNKNSGDTLTATEWNSLDTDFITTESDPTVPANIKDGVAWSEISGKPTIPSAHGQTGCTWTGLAYHGSQIKTCSWDIMWLVSDLCQILFLPRTNGMARIFGAAHFKFII